MRIIVIALASKYGNQTAWIRTLAAVLVVLATLVAGCCAKISSEDLLMIQNLAGLGDADAQQLLGDMYLQGQGGVPLDYAEAARWYRNRKAAEQGSIAAQNNLGVAYIGGSGVPQDNAEAYAWFSIAADQGLLGAAAGRDEAAKWMTDADLWRAQELAGEYRVKFVLPFRN